MSSVIHSKLGASSAERWTNCTRSISFIEENKDRCPDKESIYSTSGSDAHDHASAVLKKLKGIEEVPEHDEEGKELRVPIRLYTDTCNALIAPDSVVFIEELVPLWYKPDDVGTVDFLSASPKRISCRDYKHGEGVLVPTEYNKQMAIYTMAAIMHLEEAGLFEWEPDTVVDMQISQPRHREWEDQPWITSLAELREFCALEITPKAKIILEGGDLAFVPTEKGCFFCPAKHICPSHTAWQIALPPSMNPMEVFTDLESPIVQSLSDKQLYSCYRNADQIIKWFKGLEEYLLDRAQAGNPLAGTKLVQGREGNRQWTDEHKATVTLQQFGVSEAEQFVRSMISPAQMEKVLKAKGQNPKTVDALCSRAPGKPVLALESDPRVAIKAGGDKFENLDG